MSEKHRNLPPWMVKSEVQSKDNEAVKKKTRGETTKRIAKKRLESVVKYWMNERELVETALSHLKEDKACAKDATQAPEEVRIIPETDEDMSDSDVQDRTYVSNITEQETVPYGNCLEESTSTKPDCHLKPPSDGSGASEKPYVDDDALELVREIFFT
ncbi:uncharacterized protein si:ch211-127m7.2 [Onychostoma macrolepis]|uniref:Uncharacterized protein n=1 Tax=Onychostoma macrolepis TaxID=369639 RepID=A0A7J6BLQ6_9TELE|nr:uncharacterized protein si:ch211-127m7.2 [Onychostoma macrolepis]KAF4095165.1 hypothetical protein G5714_024243 [Onychostoma macrolepis]